MNATASSFDDIHNFLIKAAFIKSSNSVDYDQFRESFRKIFRAVIVGSSYYQDQVFIVKAADSIWKEDPCTADLGDMDDARVCIDGTTYISLSEQAKCRTTPL